MENTSKIIKDCMLVSKVADICMQAIHSYMNDTELRSHKQELERKATPRRISPEIMNDPENLAAIQQKREKARSQLTRIQNFEHLIHTGAIATDLDVNSHPDYIVVLGQKIQLATPFNQLHPLARIQMEKTLELCSTFLRYDYIQEAKDAAMMESVAAECNGDCEHCEHHHSTDKDIPDEVKFFFFFILGVSLDDVHVISAEKFFR